MKKKLSVVLVGLALSLSACASSSEPVQPDDEENLDRTHQALCVGGPGPRPTPVASVPGFGNTISSGTYNYGSGACDGYPVALTQLQDDGYGIFAQLDTPASETACDATTITLWIWQRVNGGAWTYVGTHIGQTGWWDGSCFNLTWYHHPSAQGSYEVIVKAQARTEIFSGGYGSVFNRPIKLTARRE